MSTKSSWTQSLSYQILRYSIELWNKVDPVLEHGQVVQHHHHVTGQVSLILVTYDLTQLQGSRTGVSSRVSK